LIRQNCVMQDKPENSQCGIMPNGDSVSHRILGIDRI
jgi:hypothetical protein